MHAQMRMQRLHRYGAAKTSWDQKLRGTGRISNTSKPLELSPTWSPYIHRAYRVALWCFGVSSSQGKCYGGFLYLLSLSLPRERGRQTERDRARSRVREGEREKNISTCIYIYISREREVHL
jgi:hypothetical protein